MSMIGKSLVHYEISAQIGRGGMGEVYRAKDTKLGRDVAIKVLPEEFARDTDRVARFQREAKLLASLNHPNIAAIYGLEESEGTHFLVMELIEGQTLEDRIKTSPIPVEEALKLALQMAEALEAAHEKGVIHRDLKPANIKVTPDGKVKVLDFGLAKAYAGDQENVNLADSPTISAAATQQGVILGTAAYMSPEQARGKPVDKRADIWAFGVVLYEMLTGRSLFEGEDVSSTLARVLERRPDYSILAPNLHPRIRFLLERCLEKEVKDRYSGISDARVEIQKVLTAPGGVYVQPIDVVEPQAKLRIVGPGIAIIILVGIIVGVAVWIMKPIPEPEPRQVIRFEHELSAGQQFSASSVPILAISPDGSHFVYSTNEGLYLRSMDELDARHLTGTDGNSRFPFFSPNGKWIGYVSVSDMKLIKIAIHEGTPMTLCDVPSIAGGFSWSSDNRILHAVGEKIMWTSDDGGEWESLIEENIGLLGYPQMLPGGEAVIFVNANVSPFKIVVRSLKSGKSEELLEGYSPRYIKTGHIVYGAEDNLYIVPFDIDTLKLTGGKTPIIKDVSSSIYHYDYDVSDSGTLVYLPSMSNQRIFTWVDREGKEEPLAATPNLYVDLRISPDGKQVATSYYDDSGNDDIWIWDLVSGKFSSRTTFFEGDDWNPIWTSDGKQIIYSSSREGGVGIFRRAANGTGKTETLHSEQGHWLIPWSLSPNGDILAITVTSADQSNSDIGTVSLGGDNVVREMLLKENYHETQPQISPNGKWMTYASNQTGKLEVYVCAFPNVNEGIQQVSNNGGYSPIWSPDGSELFYRTDNAVMAVTLKSSTTFEFETPIILFPDSYAKANPANGRYWDISPDDNRFLMLKNVVSESNNLIEINIVLNWFEELKEKVPVD
jgi:serine/threonine protein kinase